MKSFISFVAMCCMVAVQAMPSGRGHQDTQLVGIPDHTSYSKLVYPHLDLIDLGTVSHGQLPPKEVKVIRTIKITVPKPYPVKVPHKVPYPVPVDKPYPVTVTKLVKVPQPVPVEVIKSVPVPVEVPKPYPVPEQEYNAQQAAAHGHSSQDQSWQPSSTGQDGGYQYDSYQEGHFQNSGGFHAQGHADQTGNYAAIVASIQQNVQHAPQEAQPQQQQQQHEVTEASSEQH